MKNLSLLFIVFLFSGAAHAKEVKNAFYAELSQNGIQLATELAKKELMKDIHRAPIPAYRNDKTFHGFGFMGAHFNLTFDDVNAYINGKQLTVRVRARNFTVRTKYMYAYAAFAKAECENMYIMMGTKRPIYITVNVTPSISQEKVRIKVGKVIFDVKDDNYSVLGPQKCKGSLKTGGIFKWGVNKAVGFMKKKIVAKVKAQIKEAVPKAEEKINEIASGTLPINLAELVPLPTDELFITYSPYSLSIDRGTVKFAVNLDFVTQPQLDYLQAEVPQYDFSKSFVKIGLNSKVLTELSGQILNTPTEFIELPLGLIPEAEKIVTAERLASIWPDLNYLNLGEDDIKFLIKLKATPVFDVLDKEKLLAIKITGLDIKTQIVKNNKWVDYFVTHLDLTTSIDLLVRNQKLIIGFGDAYSFKVSGEWAKGYKPNVKLFEADMAEMLFKSVFDYLYESSPLVGFDLPLFPVNDIDLGLEHLNYKRPFIEIDIHGNKKP